MGERSQEIIPLTQPVPKLAESKSRLVLGAILGLKIAILLSLACYLVLAESRASSSASLVSLWKNVPRSQTTQQSYPGRGHVTRTFSGPYTVGHTRAENTQFPMATTNRRETTPSAMAPHTSEQQFLDELAPRLVMPMPFSKLPSESESESEPSSHESAEPQQAPTDNGAALYLLVAGVVSLVGALAYYARYRTRQTAMAVGLAPELEDVEKGTLPRHAMASIANSGMSTIKICDVMANVESLITVTPQSDVNEAIMKLVEYRITGLPVVDEEGRLVGILSDYDILALDSMTHLKNTEGIDNIFPKIGETFEFTKLKGLLDKGDANTVEELMTGGEKVKSIQPTGTLAEGLRMMLTTRSRRIPVIDASGKFVGLLTRTHIIRAALNLLTNEAITKSEQVPSPTCQIPSFCYSKAGQVMTPVKDITTISPDMSLVDALKLCITKRVGALSVVDGKGHLQGIVSDYDLLPVGGVDTDLTGGDIFPKPEESLNEFLNLKHALTNASAVTVAGVMSSAVISIKEDTPLVEAGRLIMSKSLRTLPVVDSTGKLLGLITRATMISQGLACSMEDPIA